MSMLQMPDEDKMTHKEEQKERSLVEERVGKDW